MCCPTSCPRPVALSLHFPLPHLPAAQGILHPVPSACMQREGVEGVGALLPACAQGCLGWLPACVQGCLGCHGWVEHRKEGPKKWWMGRGGAELEGWGSRDAMEGTCVVATSWLCWGCASWWHHSGTRVASWYCLDVGGCWGPLQDASVHTWWCWADYAKFKISTTKRTKKKLILQWRTRKGRPSCTPGLYAEVSGQAGEEEGQSAGGEGRERVVLALLHSQLACRERVRWPAEGAGRVPPCVPGLQMEGSEWEGGRQGEEMGEWEGWERLGKPDTHGSCEASPNCSPQSHPFPSPSPVPHPTNTPSCTQEG